MSDVFDLPHLIADVVADVQPAADDRGVHVAAHSLAAMPQWVEGDEPALRRMLLNTLDLVVGAATDGTVILRLDPHESSRDRWICEVGWRGGGQSGDCSFEEVKSAFIITLRPVDSPAMPALTAFWSLTTQSNIAPWWQRSSRRPHTS